MNRTGLLTTVAVMLATSPSFAQFGGMGGAGGGIGGGGAPAMMRQGGRAVGAGVTEIQRSAKVEMEGGQLLTGKINLRPVIVDADLGQYVFAPGKIKMIRFLKPVNEGKPGDEAGEAGGGEEAAVVPEAAENRVAALRVRRGGAGMMAGGFGGGMGGAGGLGMVPDANSRTGTAVLSRGKVITTADKEIIGMIHIPGDFRLELEFGALTLAPIKLRSITFTDDDPLDKLANAEAAVPSTRDDAGRPASGEEKSPPRYFRQGNFLIVVSPVGDRATLYNLDSKKSESLELSGSKEGPLEVSPVLGDNLVALLLKGPKVTRIAIADTASGTWHSQALRKPFEGQAVPIMAPGIVIYKVGRDVYAYSTETERWDMAELPEGSRALPSIARGTATIESNGHIFTFVGKTGKWDHVDVRALLGVVGAEKK